MADVQGRPFLDYLVNRLFSYDVSTVIICVSYMRENIVKYFDHKYEGKIRFSIEETPLGTGGALANVVKFLATSSISLVLNGDTFLPVDYREVEKFHVAKDAEMTMVLSRSSNLQFANVEIDSTSRITEFGYSKNKTGLVNGGLYCMAKDTFKLLPQDREFSLEKDFLPDYVKCGKVYGYVTDKMFVDIGTPQSYLSLLENGDILKK